jgi:hypothetical protein
MKNRKWKEKMKKGNWKMKKQGKIKSVEEKFYNRKINLNKWLKM